MKIILLVSIKYAMCQNPSAFPSRLIPTKINCVISRIFRESAFVRVIFHTPIHEEIPLRVPFIKKKNIRLKVTNIKNLLGTTLKLFSLSFIKRPVMGFPISYIL